MRIEPYGLGQTVATVTIYVPSYRGFLYDGLGSLDRTEAESWLGPGTIHGFDRRKLTVAAHACRIAPLDSLDLAPAFLKIDVQGLEYDVLMGARGTIAARRPAILVEDFESDPRIGALMVSLGYDLFHVVDGAPVAGMGPGPNSLLLPRDRRRF